ncbi:hypothetical protein [Streptomyces sp. NBC_01497]|uniref:hypothetical protein n=1 Tax=Streptomyces sp. NBC_01497 TaxID=2903885 RepID=UPI002E320610|nr:hypothetical protein [Streptomyces sp. NBC_01497]
MTGRWGDTMSFDAQWAQAKTAAREHAVVHTELNSLRAPDGGGDPSGDLAVNRRDLAAVGNEAYRLHGELTTDGTTADGPTRTAGTALGKDFALGAQLPALADAWGTQVDSLLSACALISDHLDYTKNAHADEERYLVSDFTYAQLDEGFGHGKGRS